MGLKNNKVIIHKEKSSIPNRNYYIVGGPGSYKTQSFVLPNVLNITEESIVVTDPKGEIFENTAKIKKLQGYDVKVINFKDMCQSDKYNPLAYVRKDIDATTVANAFIAAKNDSTRKDIWYNSQLSLLKALILYVKSERLESQHNMEGILAFLQEFDSRQDEYGSSLLDKKFEELSPSHPARRAYDLGFSKTEDKMRSSVLISLLSTIGDFVDEDVSNFTKENSFELKSIAEKKTILYVLIPTMDKTWEGLINLFFTQLFKELYTLGDQHESKLPMPVVFLLDEFPNLGKFENYEEFLATCRGYRISCCTICQNNSQLTDKYGKNKAESILGNCAVKICLGNVNESTSQYFSDLCGKTTVKIDTGGVSVSNNLDSKSHSNNYSYSQRPLITPDEILRMDRSQSLLLISGKHPIKIKKALQFELYGDLLSQYRISQQDYVK